MASTFTIQLHNLRFFGAHGMYEQEAVAGNEFEVNMALTLKAAKTILTKLEDTINYAEVYRIAEEIFSVRKNLLETLAQEIAEALKQQFPSLKKISIQIIKLNPPITAFTGSVSVTFQKSFKD